MERLVNNVQIFNAYRDGQQMMHQCEEWSDLEYADETTNNIKKGTK